MDSSNSSASIGVFLPNFPLAAGDLLRAIEHSGSVTATSTDDAGEYYAMAMATVVPAESVQEGAIIVIPLTIPRPDEVLDFTFVAAADCMYVQLHSVPQVRRTYGHCAAYSADAPDQPLAIGAVFKFATVGSFIVAKQQLAASVRAIRAFENESELGQTPDKRQCVRQQEVLGELTDEAGGRPKGMSIYLLDLNGKKLYTRNKSDIAQREEDLGFVFRAMDITKMDYSITTDLVLQAEVYRSMLCEQGDTRAEERHEAFISCGLISRIQGLKVFSKFEKLKLLLIGSVLKEGATDATLVMLGITPFFRAFGPQAVAQDRLLDLPDALAGFDNVLRRSHRAAQFAMGFAVHRMDHDAPVLHEAALLHDFAELLLWLQAPGLALEIQQRMAADSTLRSAAAQRAVLNIELADLQHTLMGNWRLPSLLVRITDEHTQQMTSQARNVLLAIRVARHSAQGWDNAALPDDVRDVAELLQMSGDATLRLLQEIDSD